MNKAKAELIIRAELATLDSIPNIWIGAALAALERGDTELAASYAFAWYKERQAVLTLALEAFEEKPAKSSFWGALWAWCGFPRSPRR